jgi:hypothetical protein
MINPDKRLVWNFFVILIGYGMFVKIFAIKQICDNLT